MPSWVDNIFVSRRVERNVVWRNTPDHFGRVSRLLHWSMALGILGMLALGTAIHLMTPSLANLWLYGLHKSWGLTLLSLVVLRLAWHRVFPPPKPIGDPVAHLTRVAVLAHRVLYALLVAVPVSGWFASSATGIDTVFFNRWVVPPVAPISETWQDVGFAAHEILTKALIAVVVFHIFGAIKRGIARDGSLRRMTWGRAGSEPRRRMSNSVSSTLEYPARQS